MKKTLQNKTTQVSGNKTEDKKISAIHPALKKSLGYCLQRAAMRSRQLMDAALAPYDLVTSQFAILLLLKHAGPLSQVELGNEMCIDKASMVRFLDGLEKLGFITRVASPTDRRIKSIQITPKGLKMSATAEEARKGVQAEFLSPLSEAEKKAYAEIIPKLIRL